MKSAGVGLGEDNDSNFWIENPTDAVFNRELQTLVAERAYGVEAYQNIIIKVRHAS